MGNQKTWTRPPKCPVSAKTSFKTERAALAGVWHVPFLNAYQCPHCPYWHLTSQPR